ncbi:cyclic peptide export ABC transporter [Bradyrhizobium ontarionense]|uniref:Cyclic peptide export ABC transporter n=1 Tax=Bradyrhizobium ontarionense TaxID=2898149 RepID=A0ABY3RAL9_9BRAD|nr:cyclic peptide export ABC transporter [Bradyrhizobium sp. A19]UFZ04103.1 cyclic peptide export ABC transporter [Bradyrhizobium sp. A19]
MSTHPALNPYGPLLRLLRQEGRIDLRRMLVMLAASGLANTGVFVSINEAFGHVSSGTLHWREGALFAILVLLYLMAQRYVLQTGAREVEQLIFRVRMGLLERLQRCELLEVERLGQARIHAAIGADTRTLSQFSIALVLAAQSMLLVIFTAGYVYYLAPVAFFLSGLFIAGSAAIYIQKSRAVNEALARASMRESELHNTVGEVLGGFKELKLSSVKARRVLADASELTASTADLRTEAQGALAGSLVFSQTAFFLLFGVAVFLVPAFGSTSSTAIVKSTTALLFMFGPLSTMIGAIPQLAVVSAAAESILGLYDELDACLAAAPTPADRPLPIAPSFATIELEDVTFHYRDRDSVAFSTGPVRMRITRGETIMITGGNGSGKSTLMRLLCALYPADAGHILVDGRTVGVDERQAYRDRFAAVFSDFHLFRRAVFEAMSDPQEVARLLVALEVDEKTGIRDGLFATVDLSTGQRKRLALITALLEHREVLLLDEWAADQDPHFRRKFYLEILPHLKARGLTIIAVTHDERYFPVADRRYHMEDGHIVEITHPVEGTADEQ